MKRGKSQQWREVLARLQALAKEAIEGEGKLRFGSNFVTASEIAEQFYCEKMVELFHLHGKTETEEMKKGRSAHEELLRGMSRVKPEDLWKKVFEEQTHGAVPMLIGKYKGCIIVGQPDYVFFSSGVPRFLIEHKFSRRPAVFHNYHVQARVYGYLLHDMGLDTRGLWYIIAVGSLEACKNLRKLHQKLCELAFQVTCRPPTSPPPEREEAIRLPIREVNAVMYPFSLESAVEELEWAVGFWRGRREAVPTRNPQKCKACEFKDRCSESLV
jgi:CRISPR/Cas system-associated exonuclease Cas4 (RecB family)